MRVFTFMIRTPPKITWRAEAESGQNYRRLKLFIMSKKCQVIFGGVLILALTISPVWADKPDTQEQTEEESPFVYDDHDNRDPFWPLVSKEGMIISYETDLMITDLILEGIIADSGGKSLVIVNGNIVKTGDVIGQFFISEILTDKIILLKEEHRYELNLKGGD